MKRVPNRDEKSVRSFHRLSTRAEGTLRDPTNGVMLSEHEGGYEKFQTSSLSSPVLRTSVSFAREAK